MMYIIQIMLVQKYPHACVHTPGNAEEGSQLIQPRTSERVAPLLVCARETAVYNVNARIDVIRLHSVLEILLGFLQLRMYMIYIMLVQTYLYAWSARKCRRSFPNYAATNK